MYIFSKTNQSFVTNCIGHFYIFILIKVFILEILINNIHPWSWSRIMGGEVAARGRRGRGEQKEKEGEDPVETKEERRQGRGRRWRLGMPGG